MFPPYRLQLFSNHWPRQWFFDTGKPPASAAPKSFRHTRKIRAKRGAPQKARRGKSMEKGSAPQPLIRSGALYAAEQIRQGLWAPPVIGPAGAGGYHSQGNFFSYLRIWGVLGRNSGGSLENGTAPANGDRSASVKIHPCSIRLTVSLYHTQNSYP